VLADGQLTQLGQPVDRDEHRRAQHREVDQHPEIGGAGDRHRVRLVGQHLQGLVEGGRSHESLSPGAVSLIDRRRGRWLLRSTSGHRVVGVRLGERLSSLENGSIASAPAQIAAERFDVETLAWLPFAIELARHAHDESRCAIATLGTTARSQRRLHRVQSTGSTEPFRGDDLLTDIRECRRQTRVDRDPLGARQSVDPWARHQHRAGTALPLGTAFLGPGGTMAPHGIEQAGVRGRGSQRDRHAVDGHLRVDHDSSSSRAQLCRRHR
jgi:hypothetical protein